MTQPQNQTPYGEMSVTKELRPKLKSAGFKNFNRFKREQLAEICEEYDRINEAKIRDIPNNQTPTEAMKEACHAIVSSWLQSKSSESTSATSEQSASRANTKRKQTETAESPKGKRQKVSKGKDNERSDSNAEGSSGDTDARHVAGKDNVSETNTQASETQITHKTYETRKRPLRSKPSSTRSSDLTQASEKNTTTKTSKTTKTSIASKMPKQPVAPKIAKQPGAPKKVKQSVASNAKPSQEPTRRSARNKEPMDSSQPSGEESSSSQAEMSKPAVSRVKDTTAPVANPSSASERMDIEDDGTKSENSTDSEDSSDDSADDGKEVEDDSDDSDEEQRPRPTSSKSPGRRTPHNYQLGTHRTFRYETLWDPLDERIPTSSLNWFEQVQRQRARQAQLRREAKAGSRSDGEPKTTKE